jgi:hypothetical protein
MVNVGAIPTPGTIGFFASSPVKGKSMSQRGAEAYTYRRYQDTFQQNQDAHTKYFSYSAAFRSLLILSRVS